MNSPDDVVDVLFIEDNPQVGELYRDKLELDGYRVMLMAQGARMTGLPNLPDLIFLEIGRDGRASREQLARIRSDPHLKYLPVVVVTESGERELWRQGLKLSRLDHVLRMPTLSRLSGFAEYF